MGSATVSPFSVRNSKINFQNKNSNHFWGAQQTNRFNKQRPRRCLSGIANGTGRCPADSFNGQHHRLLFDLVSPTTVQVLPSRRPCLARAGIVRRSSYRCTARKNGSLRYDSGREDRARRRPPDDRDSAHLSPSSRRCRKRCRGIRFPPTAHEDSAVDLQPPRGTASTLDRIRPPIPIIM